VLAPALVAAQLGDVTRTGVPLAAFAAQALTEHLTTGRIGVLLDLPAGAVPADQVRPQWTLVRAEQLINWRVAVTPQGETVFSQVVLEEALDTPDPADPYTHQVTTQWRELLLVEGTYVVRLWRKVSTVHGAGWQLVDERVPTRRAAAAARCGGRQSLALPDQCGLRARTAHDQLSDAVRDRLG
jgi:hypothetical protein